MSSEYSGTLGLQLHAHHLIDLAAGRVGGDERASNFWEMPHGCRKIALVRNADELIQ